jgi:hypothetical protein
VEARKIASLSTAREEVIENSKTDILQQLQGQAGAVMEDMEPLCIRMWLFAHDGLTQSAEAYAREHQILWSTRSEMDLLLTHLGLRQLPNI